MALSFLSTSLLSLLLTLGGFNWTYASQTDKSGKAMVELSADESLSGVRVLIKGSDGTEVEKTISIKAGKSAKVTWTQTGRQVSYTIKIEANESYTTGEFDVVRPVAGGDQGAFTLLSDRSEIVDEQKIRYRTPFTVSSHELQIYNTEGDLIVEKLYTDDVIEAGKEFELKWRTSDQVFMIKVTGSDDTGYSYTDTRVPWAVEIPHTEVNFDSGKSAIKPDEEWKVAEAFAVLVHELAGLDKANEVVNGDLSAQLYIVGYTDTVGKAPDNKKLSEKRAREIAKYFEEKGAWCEIHYAGMGEKGQAVTTDDSVDEVRNRRALYILGIQKPGAGGQVPPQNAWKQLAAARPRMLQTLPALPDSYNEYKRAQQAIRDEKFGDGGGSSSSNYDEGDDYGDEEGDSGYDSSDSSDSGSSSNSGGSGGSSSGGSSDGPPSVDGEPGATKQGCSVDPEPTKGGLGFLVGLFGLLGLRRRKASSR